MVLQVVRAAGLLRPRFLTNVYNRKSIASVMKIQQRTLVQLANRPYLPGSNGQGFPKYLNPENDTLPFVITAQSVDVTDKATPRECGQAASAQFQTDIIKYGAILYRNFPIHTWDDFSKFYMSLTQSKYKPMVYKGGAGVREKIAGGVYTASRESSEICIDLHNEMAYLKYWPTLVSFFCLVPPGVGCGGETAICDVREYLSNIDTSIVEKFRKLGIMYHHYSEHKDNCVYQSWQEIFQTDDKADVESHLRSYGDEYCWIEDGSLARWRVLSAFLNHPETGKDLWFNHAHKKHATGWETHPFWAMKPRPYNRYPTHCYYGDGSEIEVDVIQHLRNTNWACAVGFQMKQGDVLVMENHLIQHARLSFTGERKLLAILAS